jgi:tRNA-binding EMAP/Myf-like protein
VEEAANVQAPADRGRLDVELQKREQSELGSSGHLDLLVGRVVDASDLVGSRAPAYELTIDLGAHGRCRTSIQAGPNYPEATELVGAQVVCRMDDEPLVLFAHSHAKGLVLLRPDEEVEDGTTVA